MSFSLSIIVPVCNEGPGICDFLRHIRAAAPRAEIIVVDGESNDGSAHLSEAYADSVLQTARGRAVQMNAGAAASSGDLLWFVHADSRVPATALAEMEEALRDDRVAGGCFRLRFPSERLIFRVSDTLGNFAIDLSRVALGDHGFFCRREAFLQTGGFPEVPLMEDAEFYRALRRTGRTRQLRSAIETSPRRYEELGPYRTTAVYSLILALYFARFPIPLLAQIHSRFVGSRRTLGVAAPSVREQSVRA